jgi:hypothetical protein
MGADGCSVPRREPAEGDACRRRDRCPSHGTSARPAGNSQIKLTPLRNGDPGIAQSQALYKTLAATDFTPVVLMTTQPTFFLVRPDLPAENPREFSAYVKANDAKMQFGSAGAGDPLGLRADQFRDSMSRMFLTLAEHPRCRIKSQVASII